MLRRNTLVTLALALMVAGSATPSFAQRVDHRGAAARDAAIHDRSVKASKWSNAKWQTEQFTVYSNCMTQHGQQP